VHVVLSVGWLGAVLAYLALAVTGLATRDAQLVRSSYLTMEIVGWYVIVPLALGALLSGLVQSLGTSWGLLQHYWVVVKLALTVISSVILLLHMPTVSRVAAEAAAMTLPIADPGTVAVQLVVHAAGGLLVLGVITALSVFKPWGRTPWA